MGVSVYKIKKWYKMLAGKSISHVNQGVGTCYSKAEVRGYYNDLTEKVTKDSPEILVPQYYVETGEKMFFSIGIFQYGLASYDLYLKTHEQIYRKKFLACAQWALENQENRGGWITFAHESKSNPYSSMAQGEGASLLLRCYLDTGNSVCLDAAKRAIDFMLVPLENGGTAKYDADNIYFYEFPEKQLVLNGWIFSIWGIYDYCKCTNDERVTEILSLSLESLKKKLPVFDTGYWSKYDEGKNICSPFYQKLHVAQLRVMYDLFGDDIYRQFADKWEGYQKSFLKSKRAFIKKAFQKIFEKS